MFYYQPGRWRFDNFQRQRHDFTLPALRESQISLAAVAQLLSNCSAGILGLTSSVRTLSGQGFGHPLNSNSRPPSNLQLGHPPNFNLGYPLIFNLGHLPSKLGRTKFAEMTISPLLFFSEQVCLWHAHMLPPLGVLLLMTMQPKTMKYKTRIRFTIVGDSSK